MRRIYAIIICLCSLTASYAQQNGQRNQNQNQRQFFSPEAFNQGLEEFVKKEVGLSDDECKEFFPLMHEMMNKQRDVNSRIQQTMAKGFNAKTEADYEQIITKSINLEIESRKIEQTYYRKCCHYDCSAADGNMDGRRPDFLHADRCRKYRINRSVHTFSCNLLSRR